MINFLNKIYEKTKSFFIKKEIEKKQDYKQLEVVSSISQIKLGGTKKKLKYEYYKNRLEETLKNTTEKVEFNLGFLKISYINKIKPLPKIFKADYLNEGSNNIIYVNNNLNRIYRTNIDPINVDNKDNITEKLNECLLALKLSKLKLSPKIYDCYFAKNKNKKNNTHLIIEYQYAENGNLDEFLNSTKFYMKNIQNIVEQIYKLYEKLIANDVFCVDVKADNIVVDKNLRLYLIDIGDRYCSSKEFDLYSTENICESYHKNEDIQVNDDDIKSAFVKLNILQIGAELVISNKENKKIKTFVKSLIETNINITDLPLLNKLSKLKIAEDKIIDTFKHYIICSKNNCSKFEGVFIDENSSEIILLISYLICVLEIKEAVLALKKLTKDDKLMKKFLNTTFFE